MQNRVDRSPETRSSDPFLDGSDSSCHGVSLAFSAMELATPRLGPQGCTVGSLSKATAMPSRRWLTKVYGCEIRLAAFVKLFLSIQSLSTHTKTHFSHFLAIPFIANWRNS